MTLREQVMKEIEEHIPQEKEAIVELEKKISPTSAWNIRDEIKQLAEKHDIMNIINALEDRNYLEVAWELHELLNQVDRVKQVLNK